jgi:arginyl-tRNA--protein-N-Asp/Glu arginylyltransferase
MYGMENNYKYLYLGYYIKEVSSMAYKIRFKPGQILEDGSWNNI